LVVVNFAKNDIKDAVLDRLEANLTDIAVGDDNTTPVEGNTALGNQTLSETAFAVNRGGDNVAVQMFLDVTENNGNSIKETGTKDVSGNLYSHSLTNVIAKNSSTEVFIEVKFVPTVTNT